MRCLLIAANPSRIEPYAGILGAVGYDVDVRVCEPAAGATLDGVDQFEFEPEPAR